MNTTAIRRAKHAEEERRLDRARASSRVQTRETLVDSPYGPGNGKDRVERVIDVVTHLLERGHIDKAAAAAGDRVRLAYEGAAHGVRCALAANEGHGSGIACPPEAALIAAGDLKDVMRLLGELDGVLVIRICGVGLSMEATARMMFAIPEPARVPKHLREHVGQRLRLALTHLAMRWSGRGAGGGRLVRMQGVRTADAGGSRGVKGVTVADAGGEAIGQLSEGERERVTPRRSVQRRKRAGKGSGEKCGAPDKGT